MAQIEVHVANSSGQPVAGAKVEFDWNALGFPQHYEALSDNFGTVKYDNGATSAEITIKATKYPYTATTVVNVGLFGIGVTPPNPQMLILQFSPTQPVINSISKIWSTADQNAKILILAVGIPFGLMSAYLIYRWVSTGQFIGTAKSVGGAVKGAIKK